MRIFLFITSVVPLLYLRQDEPKKPIKPDAVKHETIVITIPKFYESTPGSGSWENNSPKLIIPEGIIRKYAMNIVDHRGFCIEPNKEVDREKFYSIMHCILRYGVTDNPNAFTNLNAYFLNLIKYLLGTGIIDAESIAQLRVGYMNTNWVESLYYLDEAVPGTMSAEDWKSLHGSQGGMSTVSDPRRLYFEFLCELKAGSSVNYLLENLDKRFDRGEVDPANPMSGKSNLFENYAKMYGTLARRGAVIRPSVIKTLASSYLSMDEKYEFGFMAASKASGVQFSKEVIEESLSEHIRRADKPIPNVITDFRLLNMKFPKELAEAYRDALLEDFGQIEDIEYMISIAVTESDPEFWKRYANNAWDWYKSRTIRKGIYDPGDYYHAAIESYRRVQDFVEKADAQLAQNHDEDLAKRVDKLRIADQRKQQLINAGEDKNVRTRDLIFAYSLTGLDPRKSSFLLEKLDKRIAEKQISASGVYYDEIGDYVWLLNDFGDRLVPFADSIELAEHVNDPVRIRELSDKVVMYILAKIRAEANDLETRFQSDYAQTERTWASTKLPFGLNGKLILGKFKDAIRVKALCSLRAAAFVELDGIIQLYESLNFRIGLRSLAHHLFEYSLDLPARRVFHLAGLGKEAEEQCFSKKTDEFWQKKQEEFVYRVRLHALTEKK
ncbi:MAG: hypothetical protein G01um10143_808 [Parcubacteria group bacterium Gr01-1014_3]|nr:MAG: hypothetical protein G01um10143_808 [Parcubacteria group bacterium Gr01-1014_3]